jgi:hypothetical protein
MEKRKRLTLTILLTILLVLFLVIAFFFFKAFTTEAGRLSIDSYPRESEAYVNGELKGKTPLTLNNLKLGQYEVDVKLEGYKEVVKIVTLTRNDPVQVLYVPLEHLTFTLEVTSYPTEADVYVDGIKEGVTPLTIDSLLLGNHFVEVKMPNFSLWSQQITAETDKTIQLYAELHPSSASISITSVPDGADVLLNNQKKGITPFTMDNVLPGTYSLIVMKDGFIPYTESITIAKGDLIQRDLVLQKADTYLMITSTPPGCNVYLNDILKGTTPYSEANLAVGTYSLRLEAAGYLPFSTTIQIEQGKTKEYDFSLVKLP